MAVLFNRFNLTGSYRTIKCSRRLLESLEPRLVMTFVSIDGIDEDIGEPGDFVTTDQFPTIHGSFTQGTELSVQVDGVQFDASSTELSTLDDTWLLDLAATELSLGEHLLTATVTDAQGVVASDEVLLSVDHPCNVDQLFALRDEHGAPISSLTNIWVDVLGEAHTDLNPQARMASTTNEYFVDELAVPGGNGLSWETAFADIVDAFTELTAVGVDSATLHVADGNYTWGDVGNVGFQLNIIGQGIGATVVQHIGDNDYAAQFRAHDLYIEGMTFVGGTAALDVRNSANVSLVSSEFTGSTALDGVNIVNASAVVVVESSSHHNESDGFSYTNPSGAPMEVLEVGVVGSDNGLNQAWNSQGSTTHKSVDIVRVGSVFERNPTNISDVSTGRSWNVDVITSNALALSGNQFVNLNVSGNGLTWVIGGDHSQGSNVPTVVNAQPGAEIRYVAAFNTLDPATHGVVGQHVMDQSPLVPMITCPLGTVDKGIAAEDAATGTGYIMYSSESVFTRFANSRPLTGNSANLIAVRNIDGTWQYSNNQRWVDFTSAHGDRLLAAVDFSSDTIDSLQGASGQIEGIEQGFLDGDLAFTANHWNGSHNRGEFLVDGTFFTPPPPGITGTTIEIGSVGSGIAVEDVATGLGYLMYSPESVFTRFVANPPHAKNAVHLIAVRHVNSIWEYSDNTSWFAFTPMLGDHLLAAVDFSNDTVTPLQGQSGLVEGIPQGFIDADLVFSADQWNGKHNNGEFSVSGSYFTI